MTAENRERFFERIRPFHGPSALLDIELAYTMAKFSHRAQTRNESDTNGEPLRYFEHVRRVALVLVDEVKIVDRDMIVAALLHDGMEDTRDLTPELIEHVWGPDVVGIVKTLSKVPKDGYLDRFMQSTDWRSYVIKACDRLDNLRSLGCDVGFRTRQINETLEKYVPLFDRMYSLTPKGYRSRVGSLRDTLLRETTRQATLLELDSRSTI